MRHLGESHAANTHSRTLVLHVRCAPCLDIYSARRSHDPALISARQKARSCGICHASLGAMIRVSDGPHQYAHPVCAWWTPEYCAPGRGEMLNLEVIRRREPERAKATALVARMITLV